MASYYKYKKCKCSKESWEVITVDHDENYDDRRTIYHHCDQCGEDFVVIDFETEEFLYVNEKFFPVK